MHNSGLQTCDFLGDRQCGGGRPGRDASGSLRRGRVARIDEVQFRRLQEAEQARKSLGRMARLRLLGGGVTVSHGRSLPYRNTRLIGQAR